MKYFLRLVFIFSLLSISAQSYAQDWTLIMEMLVTEDGKKLSGAEINVYRNGSFVEKVLTDSKGQADIPMQPGGTYSIEVGGNNGLIKKKIEVNTANVPPEEISGETYFPAEVDIFKKLDGLDYAILEKPIGKILYDPSISGFDADREYTKQMKSKLVQLQEDYLEQKEKEAELAEQKQEQYDEAIKAADKAFGNEQWEEAEKYYKKAAELMPIETYPTFQLAELETKLIKIRETNKKYDDAIGKADAAVAAQDYKTAVAEYKRASGYKPDEDYPQDKLKEVQDLLANQVKIEQDYLAAIEKGDNALKVKDLNTAKGAFEEAVKLKPNETYPQNKLAEINDILQKEQQKDEEYNNAIAAADQALEAKDYKTAKTEYQKAASIKPTESYPTEQITKVDELMAAAAKKEQKYLAAIETADNALAAKKYEEAKTAYETASGIKPEEEYPKNKIKEINDFIAKQEAKAEEYQAKIDAADKALADKEYEAAKTAYNEAAQIKPTENYPQEKITEIDGILANLAQQEENYNAAVKKGDNALAAENYEAAKTAYNEALGIKPDEQYPKDKLGEIETIVVEMQQKDEEYNKAITDGDDALAANDLEKAKGFYQAASKLKPEEQYPKDKVAEIETKIAEQAEVEKNYTAALEAGDAAMGNGDLETAKAEYSKAAGLKPDAQPPKDKLAEIEKMIAEKEATQAEYQTAIDKGDQALAANELENAKAAFEEAKGIKPEESYPQEKLTEIEGLIAAQAEKEANYQAAIDKADDALAAEKYEEAKAAYNEALAIKEEEYPQTKIAEIDNKLAEIAASEEAAAKLEADYQAAVAEGDQKLSEKKYDEAIAAYQKALELKAEEEYPSNKISEIEEVQAKLAEEQAEAERLAKIQAEYDSLITEADKKFEAEKLKEARTDYQAATAIKAEEEYPKTKVEEINGVLADAAEQEEQYQAAIEEADKLLSEEKWEEAKAKYAEASSIKTEEQYPKDKIAEIDTKLEEIAAKQEEIRLQQEQEAETEAKYQELIASADELFNSESYSEAKAKYEEALTVKEEQYPKDKIAEIETKLTELAAQKEQAEIDAEYQGLIAEADALLEEEKLEEAKSKYQAAIAVKDEQYPKDQITAIDEQMAALEEAQAEEAAAEEQAKIDAEYQGLIAEADALLEEEKLEEAKSKYQAAIAVKDEQYPKDQITAIDEQMAALAEAQAEEAAAEEQAKIDAEYQGLIAEADALLEEEKLEEAKSKYQAAIAVKDEQYPKDQIATINEQITALAEQQAAQEAAAEQAKIDADYQAAIAEADKLLEESKLQEAKSQYQAALEIKDEQYPKDQIASIDERMAALAEEQAAQAAAAEQAKKEAEYQALIAEADALLEEKKLEEAKRKYESSLAIKEDPYPVQKIEQIDGQLKSLAEKEAAAAKAAKLDADYLAAIENGDQALQSKQLDKALNAFNQAAELKPAEEYPKNKIKEIEQLKAEKEQENAELEKNYQLAVTEADSLFQIEQYDDAIGSYNIALSMKPEASYPVEQINKIEQIRADEQARQEEIRLKQEREAKNEAAYQTAIANADKFFQEKNYNEAENEYRLAKSLKPSESYPQQKLDEISSILAQKQAALNAKQEEEAKYNQFISEGDAAFQAENYRSAKTAYQSALGLKPNEDYPKSQLQIVNQKLEEEQLAREEERKNMDKPIEIQKGPKSTITDDAEKRIDEMYKEMWAQRNVKKNETVVSKREKEKELNDKNKEEEFKKRQNAIEKIENISVSLRESKEMVDELNLQNYETVKQKEEAITEAEKERKMDSKRSREDINADNERKLEDIQNFQDESNQEILAGKKEAVENELEEVELTRKRRYSDQDERIAESKDKFLQKEEDLREFNQEKASENLNKNTDQLKEVEEGWSETLANYNEESDERRTQEKQSINNKQESIREFEQSKKDSFKDNQKEVEEKTEAITEFEEENKSDAKKKREGEQQNINDKQVASRQYAQERGDDFKENQEAIDKKREDLKEETESLNSESEKRRQEAKDREFYEGEDKPREDQEAAKYPQGVTEKIIENDNNSTTIRRIVVEGTEVDIYEKTLYPYGEIYYTKNGTNITKETWDQESR